MGRTISLTAGSINPTLIEAGRKPRSFTRVYMKATLNIIIIILVFTTVVGCGGNQSESSGDGVSIASRLLHWPSLPILVNTTNADQDEVLASYNDVMGVELFRKSSAECAVPVVIKDLSERRYAGFTDIQWRDGDILTSGTISIDTRITPDVFIYRCVFAHELGHLLGFHNHEVDGPLVNPISMCPADLNQLFVARFIDEVLIRYQDVPSRTNPSSCP